VPAVLVGLCSIWELNGTVAWEFYDAVNNTTPHQRSRNVTQGLWDTGNDYAVRCPYHQVAKRGTAACSTKDAQTDAMLRGCIHARLVNHEQAGCLSAELEGLCTPLLYSPHIFDLQEKALWVWQNWGIRANQTSLWGPYINWAAVRYVLVSECEKQPPGCWHQC
jgi:hypothetical protein